MNRDSLRRWACRLAAALVVACAAPAVFAAEQVETSQGVVPAREAAKMQQEGQPAQAQRQATQPQNNAPFWRDVREGERNPYQTTQVRGVDTTILVQSEGEIWRQIRNGPIVVYGGWLFVLAIVFGALFYFWKGTIKTHGPHTGRRILRFTVWERVIHWVTAIAFVILAVSGIFMLFGRYVILPIFGYTIFAFLTMIGKNLHNFIGPLFVICTVLMILTFLVSNIPRAYDWLWVRKGGGLVTGKHVPSGKFNAGEKLWFWIGVVFLGILVSASGLVLDFPNFGQSRETMQISHIVHAVASVLFMTMSLGHIYLGTIGQEGSYEAMRHGTVDETWAREHHEYWYRDVVEGRGDRPVTPGGPAPHTAPAAPLRT